MGNQIWWKDLTLLPSCNFDYNIGVPFSHFSSALHSQKKKKRGKKKKRYGKKKKKILWSLCFPCFLCFHHLCALFSLPIRKFRGRFRSASGTEILRRFPQHASMASRERRVHVGRGQRLLQRKGKKARSRTLKPHRNLRIEDPEPFGSTSSPQLQRELAFRPNPRTFRVNQPQINFPQRQQLFRRVSFLCFRPPPCKSHRFIREQNLRQYSGEFAQTPATVLALLAGQLVHRNHTGVQPNKP